MNPSFYRRGERSCWRDGGLERTVPPPLPRDGAGLRAPVSNTCVHFLGGGRALSREICFGKTIAIWGSRPVRENQKVREHV